MVKNIRLTIVVLHCIPDTIDKIFLFFKKKQVDFKQ